MRQELGHCPGPLWKLDDFSKCFNRDYVGTLLPLTVCALSLLVLLTAATQAFLVRRRHDEYHKLNGRARVAGGAAEVDTLGFEEELDNPISDTAVVPVVPENVTTEISRPRAATAMATLEVVLLFAQVGISLAVISLHGWRQKGRHSAEWATVVAWLYTAILGTLRLSFQLAKANPLPQLWYHTAAVYSALWFFNLVLFRSAIVHPHAHPEQELLISRFALSTTLMLIALCTRKGNRAVLLSYEGKIDPSSEPVASLLSDATFSWMDLLIWRGWTKPLEIGDVWNVLPREKAGVVLASFRLYSKTTSLTFRLIRFFAWDLLYQQFWAFISGVVVFLPTLLLKAILEYVEDPVSTPKATAWLWVILLLLVACLNGISDAQGLWRGRKISVKLRTILIGEIYAKALRRRAASSEDTDLSKSNTGDSAVTSLWQKLFGKKKKSTSENEETAEERVAEGNAMASQVNTGTIINLMSVDAYKVSEISAYWHFLIPSVPVELTVAILLLYSIMGWSSIAGVVVMVAILPVNMWIARQFSQAYKRIMTATDGRIHITNEVLQNVRIIKFFAWEDRFAAKIDEKRRTEIAALRYRYFLWAGATVLWFGVPMVITALSFFLYTTVEKKPLVPSVAFTALSLFNLLKYPLDRLADMVAHVLECKVSIGRVQKFLDEEETGKYEQLQPIEEGTEPEIGFERGTFSWGSADELNDAKIHAFRLINLDISFKVGGLNIVAGPTGSGKTSLLMALLGEMTQIEGKVRLPGGYDRASLKPRPDGLTESVAYCAQQAWLVNDTIKQNILFASPLDEKRYQDVLDACALKRDLEVFESGDATLVGEKGVVVSGGQKQRISLARALYSNSRHILLDDCLSAVDAHTAQHIFDNCIMGPLMKHRTCILVTHNISLCVPRSDHVVVLANGKIAGQGSPEHVMTTGLLGEDGRVSREGTRPGTAAGTPPEPATDANGTAPNGNSSAADVKKDTTPDVNDANTRTEGKAEGSVDIKVIMLYLRAMGKWPLWVAILIGYTLENLGNVSTGFWIRQWANSFPTSSGLFSALATSSNSTGLIVSWTQAARPIYFLAPKVDSISKTDNSDIKYYLGVYVLLSVLYILFALFRLGLLFTGTLHASRKLHAQLLNSVLRAKFKFFDTTPLGQIMNRFSKDLQAIDQDIGLVAAGVLQTLFMIVVIIALVSSITPAFLVAGGLLTCLYAAIGTFYIQSSRDLKRLESAQRSPLYQQFGETLTGVTTIRAYGDERRFSEDNAKRLNLYNRPYIFLWGANRWLALRVDFAGAFVSFFAAAFIVLGVDTIDAGAAGLSLTYALGFNENILWVVRLYAENEQNMNHVERVKEFLEIEQEAPSHIPDMQPKGEWPSKGAIRFEDYTTRYRDDLDPVLKHLSLDIKGEEKVGIVGRTGAGKSSLALALFRGLEADSGKIFIDNVDIGTIGLRDLRENLTIVPQDPTLFTGTLRTNLDPFSLFTDDQIFDVLRRVHLIGPDASKVATETLAVPGRGHEAPSARVAGSFEPVFDELPAPSATGDLSAPPQIRRGSISAASATEVDTGLGPGLAKVQTNTRENANPFLNLESPVAESGTNLSQGQRQLLCLARAMLKSPRVLLMDEATASIDYATDAKIQDTLREIRGSTIITIAHRLQTVVDYDKVLVLEKGEVAEFGPPWELIRKEGGMFRAMCETSGDFDTLAETAKKAERKSRLVDIEE